MPIRYFFLSLSPSLCWCCWSCSRFCFQFAISLSIGELIKWKMRQEAGKGCIYPHIGICRSGLSWYAGWLAGRLLQPATCIPCAASTLRCICVISMQNSTLSTPRASSPFAIVKNRQQLVNPANIELWFYCQSRILLHFYRACSQMRTTSHSAATNHFI